MGSARDFVAIVNPAAGGSAGAAAKLIPLARLLREAGAQVQVEYSRGLEHARELARQAGAEGHVVLGVGGDGMVGCVGGALVGTDAVFGVVPAGRGNDFARQLGMPSDTAAMAQLLLEGPVKAVDAIEVESAKHAREAVLGSVYAGVDAVANQNANETRIFRGAASYYVGALKAIATWRAVTYRITIDGEMLERRGYTVVAANSGFYGFGRRIAPSAVVDDGLLDVVIIHEASRALFFKVMNELKDGSHVERPQVEIVRGREIRIEADRSLPYGADGEVDGELPVTVRVLPGALNTICP
jgi:YegS/Rv2252/BmrU family lipid kinase